MTGRTQKIEIDEATAAALKARAAKHGLSVSELVAEMTALQNEATVLSAEDIGELDRQWEAIKAGEATTPHEDVARWLQTWGTSAFKPWHDR